jgi:hypothetical protein
MKRLDLQHGKPISGVTQFSKNSKSHLPYKIAEYVMIFYEYFDVSLLSCNAQTTRICNIYPKQNA